MQALLAVEWPLKLQDHARSRISLYPDAVMSGPLGGEGRYHISSHLITTHNSLPGYSIHCAFGGKADAASFEKLLVENRYIYKLSPRNHLPAHAILAKLR